MKVRCPTCGAVMSLDVLIAHDDAREALIALTGISDELVKAMLRYLTLFRPAEKDLSFNRVSKLLGDLLPMIQARMVERNRKQYAAPREAWIWAANRCIEARDSGRLKTPLTSHGFLLGKHQHFCSRKKWLQLLVCNVVESGTKLRAGVGNLMEWAGNGEQHEWLKRKSPKGLCCYRP